MLFPLGLYVQTVIREPGTTTARKLMPLVSEVITRVTLVTISPSWLVMYDSTGVTLCTISLSKPIVLPAASWYQIPVIGALPNKFVTTLEEVLVVVVVTVVRADSPPGWRGSTSILEPLRGTGRTISKPVKVLSKLNESTARPFWLPLYTRSQSPTGEGGVWARVAELPRRRPATAKAASLSVVRWNLFIRVASVVCSSKSAMRQAA